MQLTHPRARLARQHDAPGAGWTRGNSGTGRTASSQPEGSRNGGGRRGKWGSGKGAGREWEGGGEGWGGTPVGEGSPCPLLGSWQAAPPWRRGRGRPVSRSANANEPQPAAESREAVGGVRRAIGAPRMAPWRVPAADRDSSDAGRDAGGLGVPGPRHWLRDRAMAAAGVSCLGCPCSGRSGRLSLQSGANEERVACVRRCSAG